MRAAVLYAFGQPMAVEEIVDHPLRPTDVRINVDASGICGSDLTNFKGHRRPPLPVVLGHEAAGTVVEIGREVTRLAVGDRVIATPRGVCGDCWFCLHDSTNLCEHAIDGKDEPRSVLAADQPLVRFYGLGTFADQLTADQFRLVKVESDLPAEQLALIGCGVATGVGAALNTARVEPGSTVAVVGCGGVGQSVIQGARIAGAARIIAVDPVVAKRNLAIHSGATDVIDPGEADPIDQTQSLTSGRGADYVFEAIGNPTTLLQSYRMARSGGTVVMIGMPGDGVDVTFPGMELFSGEKRFLSSLFGSSQVRRDYQRYIDLAEAGRLDVGSMITQRIDLAEINEGFDALIAGTTVRPVILPESG